MSDPENWTCDNCCNVGLESGDDGFYYCVRCCARADDFIETGVAEEHFKAGGLYLAHEDFALNRRRRRNTSTVKTEPLRADDFIETGVAEEDFINRGGDNALYLARHRRRRRNTSAVKAEPLSQPLYDSPSPSSFWNTLTPDAKATPKPQRPIKTQEYFDDGVGASGPEDFGGSNYPFVSMKVTETTRKRPNKIRKHK
jgi:hypothetical protein